MDTDWTFSSCSWLWEEDVTFKNACGSSDWTREEDKAFENALAVYYNDADRWDKVALAVPGKTIEDLKLHYEALSDDVVAIESGKVPLPHYPSKVSVRRKRKKSSRASVQRGIPWTEEEHRRFLYGLQRFGRGDWKSISRYSVRSKSNSQVASHAQKYFKRLNSANEGKRPSINDIRSVQPENLLALEKAATSCMPGNRKKASTNAGNQLLCRYPKESSTNTRKQLFSEYPNEASTNAGNQLLCRYPKEASTNTGKQLFSEYPNEASTNARNQLLTGYPKEVSTNVGNQLFPKYPKEASTNAGNQLLPGYPKEVSTNAGYQLFPGYPTEASTNAGNQLLPPTPFAGMSTPLFSAQAIAGPCTSAAVVPACSMLTPPFASQPIQEPGPSVGMPTYYPTIALMQDGDILPPAGSFDVPSTSYSEYEIIDLDMFVFPHFLD